MKTILDEERFSTLPRKALIFDVTHKIGDTYEKQRHTLAIGTPITVVHKEYGEYTGVLDDYDLGKFEGYRDYIIIRLDTGRYQKLSIEGIVELYEHEDEGE